MKKLLLEIGLEELPARFIADAARQLQTAVCTALEKDGIAYEGAHSYSTPRRLAVMVEAVAEKQRDVEQDVKGPPLAIAYDENGQLTKAGLGFARSQSVSEEALFSQAVGKVDYLFAHRFVPGSATDQVLPHLLHTAVHSLSFPKAMRWGSGDLRYGRPLRWLLALFDSAVVPFQINGVLSGRQTYGHRQLAPQPLAVQHPDEYVDLLAENYCIVDSDKRQQMVAEQAAAAAAQAGGRAVLDKALLAEVANLLEYPTAFAGSFDHSYLLVPKEVLVTTMKEHQRYFPVVDEHGSLLPLFVGVRNGDGQYLDLVRTGNEKVLAARLADAKFFFEEDKKRSLDRHAAGLRTVVFQEGLGTMAEKSERLEVLAAAICTELAWDEDQGSVLRAAQLAKADLTTQMVFEFPELQGIMGREYALFAGEPQDVARGIEEHYWPRFAGDQLPQSRAGIAVSLADKLDTLAGYFALGRTPTGSQDPFALRRQALGIVLILEEQGQGLTLDNLCRRSLTGYGSLFADKIETVIPELLEFLKLRMRTVLIDRGYGYDVVDAVLAAELDSVPRVFARTAALEAFRQRPQFQALYTVLERAANLGSKGETLTVEPDVLTAADRRLWQQVQLVEDDADRHWKNEDWEGYLDCMASLEPAVAEFFDAVMVMDKDLSRRSSRLALLKRIAQLGSRFAAFKLLVVEL